MSDNRPVGVFDSGVGGLTVLQALQQRLPRESTIYLGDLARCPYGTRSQEEVCRFALQIADMLAAEDIKLLVIACNTATAAAYDVLCERYPFPVVGVIAPGAQAALAVTRKGRIGVIATDRTVGSGAYSCAIRRLRPDVTVVERSASWLVPLIERGPLARLTVARALEPVLSEMRSHDVDALILGCTHFPLVRDIFETEIGPGIAVLDSAETTTAVVERVLRAGDLQAAGLPRHRLLVTGPAHAFAERAETMFQASPVIETIDWILDAVS